MGLLGTLAASGLGAWAWSEGVKKYYRADLGHDEVHYVGTSDGWRVALSRYVPEAADARKAPPVVLCHGLGANRLIFDNGKEKAFARWLCARGFDVWALDLRGHGLSDSWGWRTGRSLAWNVDDYLLRDVPAALARVRQVTGAREVDWIGHSMGGVLAYCLLQNESAQYLRSATIVGSSLNYHAGGSGFESWKKYLGWARKLPGLPMGPLLTLIAPLSSRFENPADEFNVWPPNVDGELNRRLLAHGFEWLSNGVLLQLETAIEAPGFRSFDRAINYHEGVARITKPVFVIGGDRDRQCPVSAKMKTAELLPKHNSRIKIHADYGHCDLFIGKRVEQEVFPDILAWLENPGKLPG